MSEKRKYFTTHIDLDPEDRELFNKVKGKLIARGMTLREWFLEKLREEAYQPLDE